MAEKAPRKEKFEDHLKQVEAAVQALEGGELGLEDSIERYEQGIQALRQCYAILEEAEKKIQILIKQKDGSLVAKDFEVPAAEEKPSRKKSE